MIGFEQQIFSAETKKVLLKIANFLEVQICRRTIRGRRADNSGALQIKYWAKTKHLEANPFRGMVPQFSHTFVTFDLPQPKLNL